MSKLLAKLMGVSMFFSAGALAAEPKKEDKKAPKVALATPEKKEKPKAEPKKDEKAPKLALATPEKKEKPKAEPKKEDKAPKFAAAEPKKEDKNPKAA